MTTPKTAGAQAGHLFAVRGDLTRLACDTVIVPTSRRLEVTHHWGDVVPLVDPTPGGTQWRRVAVEAPADWGDADRVLRAGRDGLGREVLLVRTDAHGEDGRWVADGLVQAVERAARSARPSGGRILPLIGLPLAGTGAGGLARRRGEVVEAVVPALEAAACRLGVDVALVLADDRDHAAVQLRRSRLDGTGPAVDLLDRSASRTCASPCWRSTSPPAPRSGRAAAS